MATLATMTEQKNSREKEKENENVDSRAGAPLRYFNDRGWVGGGGGWEWKFICFTQKKY